MADITGTVHRSFGGKEYTLRLTFAGLAKLQEKFGPDIGGLVREDAGGQGAADATPSFAVLLGVVSVALQKGMKMPPEEAEDLADDLISEDKELPGELFAAAFPDAEPARGNRRAPKKARA